MEIRTDPVQYLVAFRVYCRLDKTNSRPKKSLPYKRRMYTRCIDTGKSFHYVSFLVPLPSSSPNQRPRERGRQFSMPLLLALFLFISASAISVRDSVIYPVPLSSFLCRKGFVFCIVPQKTCVRFLAHPNFTHFRFLPSFVRYCRRSRL